jgi:hypothetical protein
MSNTGLHYLSCVLRSGTGHQQTLTPTPKIPLQNKKDYITFPAIEGGLLHPQTVKLDFLSSELSKTGQIIPQGVLDDGFATVTVVLSFSFNYFG